MSLATLSAPNFEEAAVVASEFITSLDNLPNEVQHLLQEIKLKEQRCQDLQQDIARDQLKYIKSALKQGSAPSTPSANANDQRGASTPSPTSASLSGSNSKAHLPARISSAYMEIDLLNEEKAGLARHIINLLTRTRARLDADLAKVRTLQGEPAEDIRTSYLKSTNQLRSASPYSIKRQEGSTVDLAPVIQIGESLRTAMSGAQPDNMISISGASGPSYNKKRRLTTNTSIKLPSPAPSPVAHQSTTSHSRSRLSRQSQTARIQQEEEDDLDADAEGEEDLEGEDAEEDLTLYCFCHKQSYGDMIGCDNPDCPYQWFHITCVGVKTPLPDKWYCPECIKNKTIASEKRKGRKK
ncbi:hypothetical protein GALMADRAFT_236778 [Galerina marginata CBS 339.88]|uniref:Chromatin modification-related protein n=1 Tax=Galerina marginata (strain CBS 339.88) TaxID=685588 RepID=A0A067TVZ3_GALM3|nr:hypothetical protein GALMADRAFT_236778 [Galerina marginata CBS 339.88]